MKKVYQGSYKLNEKDKRKVTVKMFVGNDLTEEGELYSSISVISDLGENVDFFIFRSQVESRPSTFTVNTFLSKELFFHIRSLNLYWVENKVGYIISPTKSKPSKCLGITDLESELPNFLNDKLSKEFEKSQLKKMF